MQRTIDASGINYSPDEREELLAEGLVILFELARRYKPLQPRHAGEKAGRFSGYAAMFLPRRLGDAWHRWHPEHRYVTDPTTGRRRWHYDPPTMSLDGLRNSSNTYADHTLDRALSRARGVRDFVPTHAKPKQQPVPAQAA